MILAHHLPSAQLPNTSSLVRDDRQEPWWFFPAPDSVFPKHPNWVIHPAAKPPCGSINTFGSWCHLPLLLAPPNLWSLLHHKNIQPEPPWVLPQHLTLQNTFLPQIPLFHFCHTHLWLQSQPPLALQAAPQLFTAVIHPCPAAGSLCSCACPACLDPGSQHSQAGVPPHPLLPHVLSFFPSTKHPEGCEPLSFHQDSLLPCDGSVESGSACRKPSTFPHGLQKSLTAFSVICQSGYSSLLLGIQPTQQSLDLTYIFNTTFHFTLLSDLSALQYWGWLLRRAASWNTYPTDTQSFAQRTPAAFRGCKGTRSLGIWWKYSYPEWKLYL